MIEMTTLANLSSTIDAIDQPSPPNKPVGHLVAELHQFDQAIQNDVEAFITKGFTPEFLKIGTEIAHILEQRETLWASLRHNTSEEVQAWKEISEKAYFARRKLSAELKFILRHYPEELQNISDTDQLSGVQALAMDLKILIGIAQKNLAIVSKCGINQEDLDTYSQIAAELSILLGIKTGHEITNQHAKFERDQAATIAMEFIEVIRHCADVLYLDNPSRRAKFNNIYLSKHQRSVPSPTPPTPKASK